MQTAVRSFPWISLSGMTTPEGIVLERLIQSTAESAVYQSEGATVLIVQPQEPGQHVVKRFLEASFLNNAHLARVRSAGILEPQGFVYVVTEPVEYTLADYITRQPFSEAETKDMAEQIVNGLAYMHSMNLVFCNLRPEAVWRSGATWKLGDFSQLRVTGQGDSRQLRATLARRLDLPPEAYEGVVLPAWDVWSLGALLRRVLVPRPLPGQGSISLPRRGHLGGADLQAPFDAIVRDCLHPDPYLRIALDDVGARLRMGQPRPSLRRFPQLAAALKEGQEWLAARLSKLRRLSTLAKIASAVSLLALLWGIIAAETKILRRRDIRVLPDPVPIFVSAADHLKSPDPPHVAPFPASSKSAVGGVPVSRDIQALLDTYVSSTKTRDIRANLDLYAPFVETFYLMQGLTQDQLAIEKKRQFQSIERVYRYALDNIRVIRPSPDIAVVTFDKKWSFGDRNPFAGAERAQLQLRIFQGAWKIVSERELKVYWTRHGKA